MTVADIARKQRKDVLAFLTACCQAHLDGTAAALLASVDFDLPRRAREAAALAGAPGMDGAVRDVKLVVAANVHRHGDFAARCFDRTHVAFALEAAHDLYAEVDVHRDISAGRVMIEEDVMSVGAQAGARAEERPDLVERRPPRRADGADRHAPADGCQRPGCDGLDCDVHRGHEGLSVEDYRMTSKVRRA